MSTEPNNRLSMSWRVLLAEFLAIAVVSFFVGVVVTYTLSKDKIYSAGAKQGAAEEQERLVYNLNQLFTNAAMSTTRPISDIHINRFADGTKLGVMITTADQVMRGTAIIPTEEFYSSSSDHKEHLDFEYTNPSTRDSALAALAKDFCNPTVYTMYVPEDQKTKPPQSETTKPNQKKPPHRMVIIQEEFHKPGGKKD